MGELATLAAPVAEADSIRSVMRPAGYRILVRLANPEKQDSKLEMPAEAREREWQAQVFGRVVELGPEAYKDKNRFPGGPWCKEGDTIVIRPYSGTRFMVRGNLYALINDDTVLSTVEGNPEEIERP